MSKDRPQSPAASSEILLDQTEDGRSGPGLSCQGILDYCRGWQKFISWGAKEKKELS